jgi:hypothetical protein
MKESVVHARHGDTKDSPREDGRFLLNPSSPTFFSGLSEWTTPKIRGDDPLGMVGPSQSTPLSLTQSQLSALPERGEND